MPFNASSGVTTKELKLTLANRMINPSLVDPDWKIVVTQLECPNSAQRVALPRQRQNLVRSADAELVDVGQAREPKGRTLTDIPAGDAFWVAPVGCLQYFPEPSGVIESFNFNNGNGVYLGNMKYSICFRRTSPKEQLV